MAKILQAVRRVKDRLKARKATPMPMTRSEIINALIQRYGYSSYLEIGVNTPAQPGYNWDNIHVETKHGVDPNPAAKATFVMTSDDFFANHPDAIYDIIFVDGLHLFEQAYRDIINSLEHIRDDGTVVVHDCNPLREEYQRREHTSGVWTGDVWKAILRLRMERPDLSICTVDTDFGCAVIRKGSQELFKTDEPNPYAYGFLGAHREDILNLISAKEFQRRLS